MTRNAEAAAEPVDLVAENERLRNDNELLKKRADMWENAYKSLEETTKRGNEILQKCAETLQANAPIRDPVAEAEEQERLIVERLTAERAARQTGTSHIAQEQAT